MEGYKYLGLLKRDLINYFSKGPPVILFVISSASSSVTGIATYFFSVFSSKALIADRDDVLNVPIGSSFPVSYNAYFCSSILVQNFNDS